MLLTEQSLDRGSLNYKQRKEQSIATWNNMGESQKCIFEAMPHAKKTMCTACFCV